MKLAYLLEEYPKLSESFVHNELVYLKKEGALEMVYSISRPSGAGAAERMVKDKMSTITRYPTEVFGKNLSLFASSPGKYLDYFGRAMSRYNGKTFAFFRMAALVQDARTAGVNHVHAHFATFASYGAMMFADMTGGSFSFTVHATGLYNKQNEDRLLCEKLAKAAFVASISEYNQKHMMEKCPGSDVSRIKVLRLGIDTKKFKPPRPGKRKGPPVILSIGRFVEKKGFEYLLRALIELNKRGVDFRARLVGGGPLQADLDKMVSEGGLGKRVKMVSVADDAAIMKYLREADIFALPCVRAANGDLDGIPVSLMEAMSMGLATVSTPVSGIPELIEDGKDGILVPERDAEALANTLENLLREKGMRERLGQEARRKVRDKYEQDANNARLLRQFYRVGIG